MKIQEIFNRKIIRFECSTEEIYKNKNFLQNLDRLFNHPSMKDNVAGEQIGDAQTTVGKSFLLPLKLPGADQLEKWIYEKILEASSHFINYVPSDISYTRTWANRMFRGCEGATHNHALPMDGVGIFYVNIPENGSDLVFVRDGILMSKISDYSPEDIIFAETKTGELILHDPDISHAISEHKNDEPRICIVVEFKYIP